MSNIGNLQATPKVFVFGSNLAGIHGKGAALVAAQQHGAINGIGYGRMGSCFAIPTKFTPSVTLDLPVINHYVNCFLDYVETSDSLFEVTPIGCGLAGYKPEQIAPMFLSVYHNPTIYWNVILPEVFLSVLNGTKQE